MSGQVLAVCVDPDEIEDMLGHMAAMGFGAALTEYEGRPFVWITDLRGTDVEDAQFELEWHELDCGLIPTPTESEENTN